MNKRHESTDAGRKGNPAQAAGAGASRPADRAASSPSSAVSGLMEERRRYEAWLSALEARRDATPATVYVRVHADYTTRLEAVVTQLTQHTEGLRAELTNLSVRLVELEDEQQQARDERAESELRAHVGELSPAEWEATARAADERIDALVARRAEVETELARTRELLSDAERPATPHLSSAAVPATPRRDPSVDASVAASVEAAERDEVGDSAEAAMHVPSAGAPEGAPPARGGSFDELAFLSSVVDTPANRVQGKGAAAPPAPAKPVTPIGPPPRPEAPRPRKDEGIQNADATADTSILGTASRKGTPMAANISGNNPIILKDKPAGNARTLKCADCGAMNFPTEWYCERCGAELASL